MEILKEEAAGALILRLSGEIDLYASPSLRAEFQRCISRKVPCLLVDFSGVEYIDSSGLATLIEYVRESESFGGRFALFGLQKKVRTIFDLVRLNELFVIADSAGEALATIAAK